MVILPFTSPNVTLETAGGKGANLARLTRAGFPVPRGFIVSTDAYRAFVEANPETKRPLYHVPHHKGVVGNAANFVYHIADRMAAAKTN